MFNRIPRHAQSRFCFLIAVVAMLGVLFGTSLAARAADDFLDPAVAFKFSASEAPGQVDVHFKIADGYYMYRERFAFAVAARPRSASRNCRPGTSSSIRRSRRTSKPTEAI